MQKPAYVTYYDCSNWRSLVEVMNPDSVTRTFSLTAFDRNGHEIVKYTSSLGGHQSMRINLYEEMKVSDRNDNAEGLVVIEPGNVRTTGDQGHEFPAVLIIAPEPTKDWPYKKYNRFVPFTRIP